MSSHKDSLRDLTARSQCETELKSHEKIITSVFYGILHAKFSGSRKFKILRSR